MAEASVVDPVDRAVGLAVRAAREGAGLSGRETARRLGIDAATWGKVERGERPLRVREALACAELLGVGIGELVGTTGGAGGAGGGDAERLAVLLGQAAVLAERLRGG